MLPVVQAAPPGPRTSMLAMLCAEDRDGNGDTEMGTENGCADDV